MFGLTHIIFASVHHLTHVSANKRHTQVVHNDEDAFVRVGITSGANRGFQFKTHPNIDKGAYSSSNVLGLKDPSRPFPTGR